MRLLLILITASAVSAMGQIPPQDLRQRIQGGSTNSSTGLRQRIQNSALGGKSKSTSSNARRTIRVELKVMTDRDAVFEALGKEMASRQASLASAERKLESLRSREDLSGARIQQREVDARQKVVQQLLRTSQTNAAADVAMQRMVIVGTCKLTGSPATIQSLPTNGLRTIEGFFHLKNNPFKLKLGKKHEMHRERGVWLYDGKPVPGPEQLRWVPRTTIRKYTKEWIAEQNTGKPAKTVQSSNKTNTPRTAAESDAASLIANIKKLERDLARKYGETDASKKYFETKKSSEPR